MGDGRRRIRRFATAVLAAVTSGCAASSRHAAPASSVARIAESTALARDGGSSPRTSTVDPRSTPPAPTTQAVDDAPTPAADWTFEVEPYAWIPSVHGEGSTDSTPAADVDLFGSFASAVPLGVSARSPDGAHVVVADGFYLRLDDEDGALRTSTEVVMVEAGAGIALDRRARWHAIAGLRYVDIDYEVQLLSGSGEADVRWLDPWIGVLGEQPITDALSARVRADVGGFGVGTRFTWQAIAVLRARVASAVALDLGYRAIGVDYEDGPVRFDAVFDGPIVGLSVSF